MFINGIQSNEKLIRIKMQNKYLIIKMVVKLVRVMMFHSMIYQLDGRWNKLFQGTLDSYSWHSVPPTRWKDIILVM